MVFIILYLLVFFFLLSPTLYRHSLDSTQTFFISLPKLSSSWRRRRIDQHQPPPPLSPQPNTTQIPPPLQDPLQHLIIQTQNWPIINRKSNQNQPTIQTNFNWKSQKHFSLTWKNPFHFNPKNPRSGHGWDQAWLLLLIRSKEWVADQD